MHKTHTNIPLISKNMFTTLILQLHDEKEETVKSLQKKRYKIEKIKSKLVTQRKWQKMVTEELKSIISNNDRLLAHNVVTKQLHDRNKKLRGDIRNLEINKAKMAKGIKLTAKLIQPQNYELVGLVDVDHLQNKLNNLESNLELMLQSKATNIDSDIGSNIVESKRTNIECVTIQSQEQNKTKLNNAIGISSNPMLVQVQTKDASVNCLLTSSTKWQQNWVSMLHLLIQYKRREGNCNVPVGHKEAGKNLGRWLVAQRQLKKKGKLDDERQTRLDELGVAWDAKHQWENMFNLLVKFNKREGNCSIAQHRKEAGKNLGRWLVAQRQLKKKGKLDDERQTRLDELGVVWDAKHQWENMFTLLVKINKREGNCSIAQHHKEAGKNLGMWLAQQRRLKRKGKLDDERQKQLDKIGGFQNFNGRIIGIRK